MKTDAEETGNVLETIILKEKGPFEEYHGRTSSMRLMSMLALVVAAILAFLSFVYPSPNDANALWIITLFLVSAFAPKALQKFAEVDVVRILTAK